jgi:hypothetical protein
MHLFVFNAASGVHPGRIFLHSVKRPGYTEFADGTDFLPFLQKDSAFSVDTRIGYHDFKIALTIPPSAHQQTESYQRVILQ